MKLRNQQKILVEEALVLVVQETDQLEQKMLHIGDREEIDVLDQVGDELERQEQREQVDWIGEEVSKGDRGTQIIEPDSEETVGLRRTLQGVNLPV